jgi:hypothetical protein
MSRKERGFKVEIRNAESILAPTLFILNFPVVLARAPGQSAYENGGRVEDFCLRGRWPMQ